MGRQRRSTRIPLNVPIQFQLAVLPERELIQYPIPVSGYTKAVNLHGALIRTTELLVEQADVLFHIFLKKSASSAVGRVVYVDPTDPYTVGVEFRHPRNVWGVQAPPQDWNSAIDGN